jgi:hypothetical protein
MTNGFATKYYTLNPVEKRFMKKLQTRKKEDKIILMKNLQNRTILWKNIRQKITKIQKDDLLKK